ncbi:unnamed protein product [Caretta caretta]
MGRDGRRSAKRWKSRMDPQLHCMLFFRNLIPGPCTFTDHSKRKHFHDEVMVDVLKMADQRVQYQKKRGKKLEQGHADRQEERLWLTTQLEDRVSAGDQALTKQFLVQEQKLRWEDRAQQREKFQQLLTIVVTRAPASSPTPQQDHPAMYLSTAVARMSPCWGSPCIQDS